MVCKCWWLVNNVVSSESQSNTRPVRLVVCTLICIMNFLYLVFVSLINGIKYVLHPWKQRRLACCALTGYIDSLHSAHWYILGSLHLLYSSESTLMWPETDPARVSEYTTPIRQQYNAYIRVLMNVMHNRMCNDIRRFDIESECILIVLVLGFIVNAQSDWVLYNALSQCSLI